MLVLKIIRNTASHCLVIILYRGMMRFNSTIEPVKGYIRTVELLVQRILAIDLPERPEIMVQKTKVALEHSFLGDKGIGFTFGRQNKDIRKSKQLQDDAM